MAALIGVVAIGLTYTIVQTRRQQRLDAFKNIAQQLGRPDVPMTCAWFEALFGLPLSE